MILQAASKEERAGIGATVGYDTFYDKFDGSELDQLYVLLPALETFKPRAEKESTNIPMIEYIKAWKRNMAAQ